MQANIHQAVSDLIVDTTGAADGGFFSFTADSSLGAFAPELILCVTIVAMLFIRLFNPLKRFDVTVIALAGSVVALGYAVLGPTASMLLHAEGSGRMEAFTGLLVFDPFAVFIRGVLLFFAVAFIIFTKLTGIPDREDGPDVYTLVLGSTLGLCLMATANHLLMIFLAVEMASVPSYVLAGLMKGRRVGSEAALKYSIYGAGAAGVMLYGISLIAGLFNTAHLPSIAMALAESLPNMPGTDQAVLAMAGLMILVGLAFKLSAVPFHFWCPDVFEGATAEVNAFLSVASKAAALALLVRVAIGFGAVPTESSIKPGQWTNPPHAVAQLDAKTDSENSAAAEPARSTVSPHVFAAHSDAVVPSDEHKSSGDEQSLSKSEAMANLEPVRAFIAKIVALLAIMTCTFGNLAAYGQTNIKRLMAYSTIAHAGYMMMPVPVIMLMATISPETAQGAVTGLCIYIAVYVFMNLGAFAIIAFLRNDMRSEEIVDYAGLVRQRPALVVCFAIILFSLIGMPPMAGFIGKFAIFASLAEGYTVSSAAGNAGTLMLVLLVAGGLNTAISLFYYLRVAKVMTLDPWPDDRAALAPTGGFQALFVFFTAGATVVLFFWWDLLSNWAHAAAQHLLYVS